MSDFDLAFKKLLEEQRRTATGQRLDMLNKDLTGTRKLLETTIWPIMKSLDGIVLEKEMVSLSGVKIYVDVFYEPLGIAFECDGFVAHGENLTRDRFTFERMRIRSVAVRGYRYFPFSYDEMEKKPEACQRAIYELMGRYASAPGAALMELPIQEREIVRLGWAKGGESFTLAEACRCLLCSDDTARSVLKRLVQKKLLCPLGRGTQRFQSYQLTQEANTLMN